MTKIFCAVVAASERYGGHVKRLYAWGAFATRWKSGINSNGKGLIL